MRRHTWILSLVFLTVSVASAAPVPPFDLVALTKGADIVAIGLVGTVTERGYTSAETPTGPVPAKLMSAEFNADQLLKGSLDASTISFEFLVPDSQIGYRRIQPATYCIVFLKRSRDTFQVLSSVLPTPYGRSHTIRARDRANCSCNGRD